MSGNGGNQFDPALLTKEINASNAAESDGEESVSTSEVGIIAESEEEQNQAEKPGMLQDLSSDPDYDADS